MGITVGTDSYITVADATTILEGYFDTDNWTGATTDTQEKALKQATRNIDAQLLKGSKYVESQELEFPRNFTYVEEAGEIPDKVKQSCSLEALAILDERAADSSITALQQAGIKSQSIEGTSVTFLDSVVYNNSSDIIKMKSKEAKNLLRIWLETTFARW